MKTATSRTPSIVILTAAVLLLAQQASPIIVEFNQYTTNACFYIRGHYAKEEFSCQFGVSGDGPTFVHTSVSPNFKFLAFFDVFGSLGSWRRRS